MQKQNLKKVIKMDGLYENFIPEKVCESVWLAAKKVGEGSKELSYKLGEEVLTKLYRNYPNGEHIKTLEIGELIERVLIEKGQTETAKEYIRYRENKKHMRQDKESLGVKDDIGLSYNTLFILK